MERKTPRESGRDDAARDDRAAAERERAARQRLLDLGADRLDRRPWRPAPVPPSAVDLVQYYVWRAGQGDLADAESAEGALAALGLVAAARAELDQLEAGLLFTARSTGLTWGRMAGALGLGSPQACQQRFERLLARGARGARGAAS